MVKMRVVVAMSGGVDSSVAAGLLVEEGYEVIGVTLKMHDCSSAEATQSPSCCGIDGLVKARATANILGIRHYVYDCVEDFEKLVLIHSWKEYDSGRTPNPCLLCNEYVKFGILHEFAKNMGAEFVATGHYVSVDYIDGKPFLKRGADINKDQSYFLAGLTDLQLRRSLFPLGNTDKVKVREHARRLNLPVAESVESQDACLVGGFSSFAEMLRCRFGSEPKKGEVVSDKGDFMGLHNGLHNFTIGQRRNLGIVTYKRFWVKKIEPGSNKVIITDEQSKLLSPSIIADGWAEEFEFEGELECYAQIRYRHKAVKAKVIRLNKETCSVVFEEPQKACAPGQAVVLYSGEYVIARGWIKTVEG